MPPLHSAATFLAVDLREMGAVHVCADARIPEALAERFHQTPFMNNYRDVFIRKHGPAGRQVIRE